MPDEFGFGKHGGEGAQALFARHFRLVVLLNRGGEIRLLIP